MKRKEVMIVLITFCLTATLFSIIPVGSQGVREYDPWYDINDDGKIDLKDYFGIGLKYGTEGTPINKTALLLDLQARLNALNASILDFGAYFETRISDLEAQIDQMSATIAELTTKLNTLNATKLDALKYDSGWFVVGTNGDYDKTHNLGTTSLVVSLWFSESADGSQRCYGPAPLSWREHNPEYVSGVTVAEITTTMIRIRTGNDFRIPSASPGGDAYDYLTSGYVRVVALAIE